MSVIDRDEAWALLTEYTESESLRRHMLAVEAAMRTYARHFGEDEELWGITGLLHDFDYERWPNPNLDSTGHPYTGVRILREQGYPGDLCDAIMGHAQYTNTPRDTNLAKALFAVDELCGMVQAIGYVRPEKLNGLTPKSVKKKLKDKAFAKGVNRDDVDLGIAELGVDPNEHIARVIEAMQDIAHRLGLGDGSDG
jgi:putative nucleotidyltransferase with HDIG domain